MNLEKVIEQLGYKRKEAQLYLAALVLGESKLADLAIKLKIPRTSALVVAERLHRGGLMTYYDKRCHRYWVAESPEKLLKKLKEDEMTLMGVLPELKSMQRTPGGEKPTVKTYMGAREIHLMFEDILITKNNFCATVAWHDLIDTFGADYVNYFIENQIKHFLKMRLICSKNESSQKLKELDSKQMRDTRFFSTPTTLNTATFIYGNKVAIISLNPTFPTGFLIEDRDVANTMRVFFEEIWEYNK